MALLLEKGVNIQRTSTYGATALQAAAQEGHLDVIKLLLEKGANIHHSTHDGRTALHIAVITNDHLDVVKLLLEKRANIDATENNGCTALHFAAFAGHLDVVKLLLEKGANIHAATNYGYTALDLARLGGHAAVAQAISNPLLDNYLDKVNHRADNDYKTYRLCGFTFNLRFFGACSAGEKKAAATTLKNVIEGKASRLSLYAHEKALTHGELGAIYHNLRESREREILKASLSRK